ncbi:hypothetical protein [Bacillus phage YungSlug]|nr:hypothetical protein [Bacillus phage YungSlug]
MKKLLAVVGCSLLLGACAAKPEVEGDHFKVLSTQGIGGYTLYELEHKDTHCRYMFSGDGGIQPSVSQPKECKAVIGE